MNILKVLTERRIKGNFGERAASKYLRKSGYKILEKNFVGKSSEIDIIAKTKFGDTTVFVEVKTRSLEKIGAHESRPAAAVTAEKQRKIISASKQFMKKFRLNTRMRYDIIEVYVEKINGKDRVSRINHLLSAFDYNTAYDAKYFSKNRKDNL